MSLLLFHLYKHFLIIIENYSKKKCYLFIIDCIIKCIFRCWYCSEQHQCVWWILRHWFRGRIHASVASWLLICFLRGGSVLSCQSLSKSIILLKTNSVNHWDFGVFVEHEGPVSLVCVSSDGSRVLAATTTGNLGYLDVSSRGYRTLMRSHTASVLGFSVDGVRRRVTTVSRDSTVRVWDMDTMQQVSYGNVFMHTHAGGWT